MLLSCPQCAGFVPTTLERCPHCEHPLAPAAAEAGRPRSARARAWATKLGTGLMISSTAMTLMACYGAPCGSDECRGYTESFTDSGYTETGAWETGDPDTGYESGTDEESDTDEESESDTQGESESDTDEDDEDETEAGSCDPQLVPKLIEYELPVLLSDAIDAQACTGLNEGSCGGDGRERVYEWVAPADALYLVSVDSGASLVVYARKLTEGSCGAELGCGVAGPGERGPRLKLELRAGQRVLLIVDADTHDEQGLFTLSIAPLE